ncbi:hypothetical protein Nepgr_018580 [Nepenthes gracilis]|uniref:AMP-dependent synthetase/ligase domain-containing protein n=1 Tax=Nepenthes gracilis TaxID=150966 RepID=A0AAD3XU56_NEPGR|nr:hypothetical protein Nepgr_018580 [Nepenthes gracilis]
MAENKSSYSIDSKSGYCRETKTYHSLRPRVRLPPEKLAISTAEYVFSQLRQAGVSPVDAAAILIDATTGRSLSHSDFLRRVFSLIFSLQTEIAPPLSKGQVALILSPPSLHLPVLYFALFALGIVVFPVNRLATESELTGMIQRTNPAIAFSVSYLSRKLPSLPHGTVLLDSTEFDSLLTLPVQNRGDLNSAVSISQSDTAAILCTSGTTGPVKPVELTHRNLIALISSYQSGQLGNAGENRSVLLSMVPLFGVFGFSMLLRAVAAAETLILTDVSDFEKMLSLVQEYKVMYISAFPPLVAAMAESELVKGYDLTSLQLIGCGGSALRPAVSRRFTARFPDIFILQRYGLTETGAMVASTMGPGEWDQYGSVGHLAALVEAKIVDPSNGEALPPGRQGELWLRGPRVMKGYAGDAAANAVRFDPERWLRTGDLCYFDSDGILYILDSCPDEEAGQIPMAFVVRKPGSSITSNQIIAFVAQQGGADGRMVEDPAEESAITAAVEWRWWRQVAPYKMIRRVAFASSIPKSPAGKTLRRQFIHYVSSGALASL